MGVGGGDMAIRIGKLKPKAVAGPTRRGGHREKSRGRTPVRPLASDCRECGYLVPCLSPVMGSRKSLLGPPTGPFCVKVSMFIKDPAFWSKEKLPIRPVCQLSSMKRRIEL